MASTLKITTNSIIALADGVSIVSGRIGFQTTDAKDQPIPCRMENGVQATAEPVYRDIVNGHLNADLYLVNPATSNPKNVRFRITVLNRTTNKTTTYRNVPIVADANGQWDFASMATGLTADQPLPVVEGPAGPQGLAGQTSFATLATQIGAAVAQIKAALGVAVENLASPSNAVNGIAKTDGSLEVVDGFGSMSFGCAGLNKVTLNHSCVAFGPYLAVAFYDPSGAFISGVPCPTPANYTATVPAGAVRGLQFVAYSDFGEQANGRDTALATWMIVPGTSLPAAYVSPVYVLPETTNLVRENAAILSAVRAALPKGSNLFDKTLATRGGIGVVTGPIDTGVNYYYVATIGVAPGRPYTILKGTTDSNSAYGDVFFDASGKVVSSRPIPRPDGCTLVAPAGAVTLRFTDLINQIDAQAVCEGTTAAYSPFAPSPVPIPNLAALLPTNGMKFAVFGDSISSVYGQVWQSVVAARLGVSLTYQDARPGRNFATLFESYGVTQPGQALGNYDGAAAGGVGNSYFNAGKVQGQSFAANLNAAAPDFGFIRLGTNDASFVLGTLGDATNSNSLAGNMRYDIELIISARPTLRLLGIGPAWNGFASYAQLQAIDALEEKVYGFYGIPYLSLFRQGFGNPLNNTVATLDSNSPAYTLTSSGGSTAVTTSGLGTHPSTFTQARVDGPAIANFALRYL